MGNCGHPGPSQKEAAWEQLIRRIASGERDALAALYDETSSLVYGLALRILGDEPAAEDIVIEVYTQAWRAASSYQAERGSPSAWLLTLTRSRAIDAARARRRNREHEPIEAAGDVETDAPGPEDLNVAAERQQRVVQALQSLGREQREVIELAYFGGLSHSEIATRLEQPLGTIKTRIRLGMMRLRELLSGLETTVALMGQERTA